MSLAPLELVSAHPWQRVVFTTYALSLSFFEAVILDALVRGGGRQALILADVQGVRSSLCESGANRVGKDYEVEPVRVSSGVFHPKITALCSEEECHLLVGSGNLTFGGWGGNCEVLEHLHPSFAADAIEDAADFFGLISTTDRIRHCAREQCDAVATLLRRSVQGKPRNGDIRLLHNLNGAISDQVVQLVSDLGGAVKIIAVAPFWDNGAAIDHLCKAIGLDHVFAHVHANGTVEGIAGSNWPTKPRTRINAVRIDILDDREPRRLHAKAFEIMCKRGRILLSGSANVTTAALSPDRNVEACVARIQRERSIGWTFSATDPPELQVSIESQSDREDEVAGVLRAVLNGDEIIGNVLTPLMSGPASVYQLTAAGQELLAETSLAADGAFRISAPTLEEHSWWVGRLVISVRGKNGKEAVGFVSVRSYADITRRAGVVGRKLFALLAGTETLADVAAIMSWFHEDPERLNQDEPSAINVGSTDVDVSQEPDALIAVAELNSSFANNLQSYSGKDRGANRNWSRFLDHIFKAFRERRGPFGRTSTGRAGEDEADTGDVDTVDEPAFERSLAAFNRLFELLLRPGSSLRHLLIAFDLTQYISERLQPEPHQVKIWLERLIKALLDAGVPAERRNDVAAAILTLLAMSPEPAIFRSARGCFLRLNLEISGAAPSGDGAQGFRSVLPQLVEFNELWARLGQVRTYQEQIGAYLSALNAGKQSIGYDDLAKAAHEEWPVLESAITSEESRKRIREIDKWMEYCPDCYMLLPQAELSKLRSTGIATAKNCCGRIIIWAGG